MSNENWPMNFKPLLNSSLPTGGMEPTRVAALRVRLNTHALYVNEVLTIISTTVSLILVGKEKRKNKAALVTEASAENEERVPTEA